MTNSTPKCSSKIERQGSPNSQSKKQIRNANYVKTATYFASATGATSPSSIGIRSPSSTGSRGSPSFTRSRSSLSSTVSHSGPSSTGSRVSPSFTRSRSSLSSTVSRSGLGSTGSRGSPSSTGSRGSPSSTGSRGSPSSTGSRSSPSSTGSRSGRSSRQGSPPCGKQGNRDSPMRQSSPRESPTSNFYAGAKFAEPPAPTTLPQPPSHWTGLMLSPCQSLVESPCMATQHLKMLLKIEV